MLEFIIIVDKHPHPTMAHIPITWLRWEFENMITSVNIDLPMAQVEETLKRHMHELDNLDFIRALQMVRHWKRTHPERPHFEGETLYSRDWKTETA